MHGMMNSTKLKHIQVDTCLQSLKMFCFSDLISHFRIKRNDIIAVVIVTD